MTWLRFILLAGVPASIVCADICPDPHVPWPCAISREQYNPKAIINGTSDQIRANDWFMRLDGDDAHWYFVSAVKGNRLEIFAEQLERPKYKLIR